MGRMRSLAKSLIVAALIGSAAGRAWAWGTEDFGNSALNAANYRDWPGIMPLVDDPNRVYHTWVNGNEHFYYRGDTAALNDALGKFAAIQADVHEVLLRPGPCEAKSFDRTRTTAYDWQLHLVGRIVRPLTTLDQGAKIWSEYPTVTVCVGGHVSLEKLAIPKDVSVVGVEELGRRYRDALASKDKTVRGWGAGHLARLDPYSAENLAAVAKLLKDEDNWVRINAVGAVAVFGKKAEPLLPTLREMLTTDDSRLNDQVARTIEAIQQAKDTASAEKAFNATEKRIRAFLESRKP